MTLLRNVFVALATVGVVTDSQGALAFAAPEGANQTRVTVTMTRESCDYYIVETDGDFYVFEWYGGSMPIEGDVLRGELDTYGFQNAFNVTQNSEVKAFVAENWLGSEEATVKLNEMCD